MPRFNPDSLPNPVHFPTGSLTMSKHSRVCVLLLRVLAIAATLSATIVMVTSHETTTFFSITMDAKFQYTPAFMFFVIANAICSVYSLLVLFVPPTSSLSRLIVVFDVVLTMLLVAAISAAGTVAQVGKEGNSHAGWLPICGQIPKFCNHVMGAMIAAFIGLVIYVMILVHSFHTLLALCKI